MFETDDYDEVLSQFDFPLDKENLKTLEPNSVSQKTDKVFPKINTNTDNIGIQHQTVTISDLLKSDRNVSLKEVTPKQTKRKLINTYFDHQSKRKFPGPAGLLSGELKEPGDNNICHMELLSQDIDFSQNFSKRDLFESPLWKRLQGDAELKNCDIDTIQTIKQQALSGHLRRRKAQTVTAFVEAVDRSVIDPLIILRDATGTIKCTLHRDAWSIFSAYIVSEVCALVLLKPTVLTTGSAFKKHYLNITLSNIFAIYSSAILKDDPAIVLPDGYSITNEEDLTVIKSTSCLRNTETVLINNEEDDTTTNDLLCGLDSIFSDDVF